MLRKLKFELSLLVLVILGIAGFFIYGKVREVQSIDFIEASTEASIKMSISNQEMVEVLKGIKEELRMSNCLTKAQGDELKIAECN